MKTPEVLGVQAVRLALRDLASGIEDPLLRDRLARSDVVLGRVAANLALRGEFDARMGARPNASADAIAWDDRAAQRWEAAVSGFAPTPMAQEGRGDLTSRLQAYFEARFPDLPGTRVAEARRLPGGRSKHTLIVQLTEPERLPPRLVLRTDSSRTTTYDSVAREYPLIRAVFAAGCPAPEPFWLEPDPEAIGAPFIVFPHMPGEPAGDLYGAFQHSANAGPPLATVLAKLHALDTAALPGGPGGVAREAAAHLFAEFEDRWRKARPDESPIMRNAFNWLAARAGRLEGEAVVVHGDAHFSNVLMHGGELVCLLDWEFWHFGSAAEDLAYCRPYMEQLQGWDAFTQAYREAGGRPASEGELALFSVWRPLRNAVLAAKVAHDFVAFEDLDLETAAIALATYRRMETQVAAALAKGSD